MKKGRKEAGIDSIVRVVIVGTVGMIAIALGWLALKQNTEGRSKAALTEKVYRNWEFKGTAEGWVGENGTTMRSLPESLIVSFPVNTGASIRQDNANTALPYGNKYLKIVLSLTPGVTRVLGTFDESEVGDWSDTSSQGGTSRGWGGEIINPETGPLSPHAPVPAGCQPMPPCVRDGTCRIAPPEAGWCPRLTPAPTRWPTPTPTTSPAPVSGSTSFDLTMYYQLEGKTTWEKPVVKTGLTSKGTFAGYAMLLPGISPLTVTKLKLQVSNVKRQGTTITAQDYTMRIDRIRLTGPVPTPTPKPTCSPPPPCVSNNTCQIAPPQGGWCPPAMR